MKKFVSLLALLVTTASLSQAPVKTVKESFIKSQSYLGTLQDPGKIYGDSLQGFDETAILQKLYAIGIAAPEAKAHISHLRRQYIDSKYNLVKVPVPAPSGTPSKKKGVPAMVNVAPCVNEGFEQTSPGAYTTANAVTGWTVESRTANSVCTPTDWAAGSPEFSIVSTPLTNWPFAGSPLGIINASPFGGTRVAQLNDAVNDYNMTRIRQTFPVTSANALLQFAFAGYWQDGGTGHGCCTQPGLNLLMYDCNGAPLACVSMSIYPGCSGNNISFSVASNGDYYSPWQNKSVDLTPYIGTCITIEFNTTDCPFGGHWGTTLLDVMCGGQNISGGLPPPPGTPQIIPGPVSFCSGGNVAQLAAPSGYASYQWIAPSGSPVPAPQGTMAILNVTAPVLGSTYTCVLVSATNCTYQAHLTLAYSQVNISGISSAPSCPNGASGTATVVGNGSGAGYTYTWVNSSNQVVGTQSVATNLAPGMYSVTIAGLGNSGCGNATSHVSVAAVPTETQLIIKPYCGTEAYLLSGGTSVQWYQGTTAISGSLGILPNYTVTSPSPGAIYWASYTSAQGCKDSVKFELTPMTAGLMTVPAPGIKTICPSASNGTAVINLSPTSGVPVNSPFNTYSIVSAPSTPAYSLFAGPTAATQFTMGGLSPGSYSVQVFDGACKYNSTFTVTPLVFNFTVSPMQSTLCPGNIQPAGIHFSSQPALGQYTYSWSPNTWLFGNGSLQNTFITPVGVPNGANVTTVYTVVVTPTLAPCAVTKTIAVTAVNPPTPTLVPVQPLCNTFPPYQVLASPAGGTFIAAGNVLGANNGIINPANAAIGVTNFTYAINVYTCSAQNTASFQVSQFNSAALTSTVPPLCVTNAPVNLMNIVQQTGGTWLSAPGMQGSFFSPANLNTGNYSVTYSTNSSPDPLACPASSTLTISVTKTLVPSIAQVQPFCTNAPPISMTVSPSGGTWSGGNISTAGIIIPANIVQPGTKTVVYSVNVGPCLNTASTTFQVSQFVPATLTGSIGELCISSAPVNLMQLVQNPGTASWHSDCLNLQNGVFSPSQLISNMPCPCVIKTKSIPDADLCPDSRTLTIHVLNPPTPNISVIDPLCSRSASVKMTVSPATGKWTTSSYLDASGVFSPSLAAIGNNAVQYVIGTPTCFAQQTKFVSVEAFVSAATTLKHLPDLCNTGSPISLLPFTFNNTGSWSGPGINGATFDPATVGKGQFELTYQTASIPSGLCPDKATVSVSVYSLQTPRIKQLGPYCNVSAPVKLTADVQGGTFYGANTQAVDPQGVFIPASGMIGDNVVSYSVASGPCLAFTQATIAVEKFIPADFHSLPPSFCKTGNAVNMDHYVRHTGGIWSGDGMNGNMFDPAKAKPGNNNIVTYETHSMPTASLCPDKKQVRLEVVHIPDLSPMASALSACAPAEFMFNVPNVNEGKASWSISDGSEETGLAMSHIFRTPGVYTVQLSYDIKGCVATRELANSFTIFALPQADFELPAEISVSDPVVQVRNKTPDPDQHRYTWSLSGASAPVSPSLVHPSFEFPVPGKYFVTLAAENIHGCKSEITKEILVKNDFAVFIPTSFSPNFDGLNDRFVPVFTAYGLDRQSFSMDIYDRWGHQIFHTNDVTRGWDGCATGKSEPLKEGVFVFKMRYKDLEGNTYNKDGHITILR